MDGVSRWAPYVWVTWLTGLVSGDKRCWWSAWFRAHFQDYEKRPDADANRLSRWKAEHAQMVGEEAVALRNAGWAVTIEDQNMIRVQGETATVGGKPDLVATLGGAAHVVDCKTGKPRDADYWQVVTYLALLTLPRGRLAGISVSGGVVYRDSIARQISGEDAAASAPRVFAAVRTVAAEAEPARVPSVAECAFCDIACCPDRIVGDVGVVETEAF